MPAQKSAVELAACRGKAEVMERGFILGARHVPSTPTLLPYTIQLPHKSQLLASGGSSSSHTQSSLDFVPPAFPPYINYCNKDTLRPSKGAPTGSI